MHFMLETWTNTSQNLIRIFEFSVLAGSKFKVYKSISMPQFDIYIPDLKSNMKEIIKQI